MQAKKDELEVQGANLRMQFMLKGPKGQLKAPAGWEWAEKAKEEQYG